MSNEEVCPLCAIREGESAVVDCLLNSGGICRRMQDIGLIKGTKVRCFLCGACGDTSAYLIRGAVIALRCEDSSNILVRPCVGN